MNSRNPTIVESEAQIRETAAPLAGSVAAARYRAEDYVKWPSAQAAQRAEQTVREFARLRTDARDALACLASAPKPGKPGPGRPPGSKNRRPAAPRRGQNRQARRTPEETRRQKGQITSLGLDAGGVGTGSDRRPRSVRCASRPLRPSSPRIAWPWASSVPPAPLTGPASDATVYFTYLTISSRTTYSHAVYGAEPKVPLGNSRCLAAR